MDGELHASEEPSEPEWGNLPTVMGRRPLVNQLASVVGTAGTETSQYREERKSTSTPAPATEQAGDSRSSGERNGTSPNRPQGGASRIWAGLKAHSVP